MPSTCEQAFPLAARDLLHNAGGGECIDCPGNGREARLRAVDEGWDRGQGSAVKGVENTQRGRRGAAEAAEAGPVFAKEVEKAVSGVDGRAGREGDGVEPAAGEMRSVEPLLKAVSQVEGGAGGKGTGTNAWTGSPELPETWK